MIEIELLCREVPFTALSVGVKGIVCNLHKRECPKRLFKGKVTPDCFEKIKSMEQVYKLVNE